MTAATEHSWDPKHYKVVDHPYPDYIPEKAKTLVIGTLPSHERNAQFEFFYGGEDNRFWPVLSVVFNFPFKKIKGQAAVDERTKLLDTFGIGITDMVLKAYRYKGKSTDEHVYPILLKDIFKLLDTYPGINRLVFTSRTYIIGAFGLFITYLHQRGIELEELETDRSGVKEGQILYKDRVIEIKVPYSPSQRVKVDFDVLVKMYTKSLRN